MTPKVLAPGHTRPVHGRDEAYDVLCSTRDAILHVMRFTAGTGQQTMAQQKAETMKALAENEINATARNSYLWEAEKLKK